MKKTQKILLIVLVVLIACSFIINISLYRAFTSVPNQIDVNYVTLKDKKIPKELNDVSIAYFTDLQFGKFENEKRLKKLIKTIQSTHPDIIIFGGDFFDDDFDVTKKTTNKMIEYLNEIEAPLGKYAVWGEKDYGNENHKKALQTIYSKSQIEILENSSVKITNGSSSNIKLIGLSTEPNYEVVASSSSKKGYDILITHQPDSMINNKLSDIDFALAGHSHGTQITYPIYGGFKTVNGAEKINRTEKEDTGFDYIVSSGIGCTKVNARLNATPEIHYIILKNRR